MGNIHFASASLIRDEVRHTPNVFNGKYISMFEHS